MTAAAAPPAGAGRVAGSLVVFVSAYLATFLTLARLTAAAVSPSPQWLAMASAALATLAAIHICEGGRWSLGLRIPPRIALREIALGAGLAILIIGLADAGIELSAGVRHTAGRGFPWREVVALFAPAAFNEELLFRGFAYQRMRTLSRPLAIAVSAAFFSSLHGSNRAVTPLALINIAIAGVLFCLAYELHQTLWLPIAMHLTWNLLSGPVLGYPVSGFVDGRALLMTYDSGPPWLSGGPFGVEGSIWVTLTEAAVTAAMVRIVILRDRI